MESRIKNFCSVALITTFMMILIVHYRAFGELTFVVSKDGLGDFTTIADAVGAAPINSHLRTIIKIKAGVYIENIKIQSNKTNLHFIGEGMDLTKITGNRSVQMHGLTPFDTATVLIMAEGFIANEITFENTAGPEMEQAVAVSSVGDFTAFYRCRFIGYQDTLNPHSRRQFYRDCEVFGTVDFIFGKEARVVFQNCQLHARQPLQGQVNTVTAHGTDGPNDQKFGFVMQNCSISGTVGVKTFFGRPWRRYSTTVIMQSNLDWLIDPRGWLEWKGVSVDKVYCAEYNNSGPGSNTSQRVSWSRVINSTAEASKFTVRNFIDGEAWIPSTGIPYYPDLL